MYLPFTLPALLISQVPTRFSPFIGAGAPSVLDIPRPDPPAPNGYEHLPDSYASALEAAWDKLEAQLAAPESDWTCECDARSCEMRGADRTRSGGRGGGREAVEQGQSRVRAAAHEGRGAH
jgi:hypothetical protein